MSEIDDAVNMQESLGLLPRLARYALNGHGRMVKVVGSMLVLFFFASGWGAAATWYTSKLDSRVEILEKQVEKDMVRKGELEPRLHAIEEKVDEVRQDVKQILKEQQDWRWPWSSKDKKKS